MPQVINTNIASLVAQRNLNKSQGELGVSLQRISSGLRINSAKDDAAGLAIADRFTAQIRGMNQAARNANDAISLAQTGEGGLQEITNNLQRMRELAVQARNPTNTSSDRTSLNAEFQQLMSENDRIAQTTAFNGQKILDGTFGNAAFQVGANVGETINVDVTSSMRTNSIGNFASQSFTLGNDLADATADDFSIDAAGDLIITGSSGTATNIQAANNGANGLGDGSAESIKDAINASNGTHGVTAVAGTTSVTVTAANLAAFAFTDNAGNADTLTYTVSINGTQAFVQGEADTVKSGDQLAADINAVSNTTGVTASIQSNGDMVLSTADGRNVEITEVLGGANDGANDTVAGYFGNTPTGAAATNHDVYKTTLTLSSSSQFTLAVANDATVDIFNAAGGGVGPAFNANQVVAQTALNTSDLLTVTNVDSAINRLDAAISDVDVLRGTFGAVQNRFESTVASLQTASENASASRSRIQDADFAQETAALTRAQILQQAGISILSQANSLPQNALSLLQ